ncbi:MAG TPA: HD domain-containing protein [Gemmatimonadaceae bacterium]|nr:HD domain-containing protein [Gemmatimonadaceae bacterium]
MTFEILRDPLWNNIRVDELTLQLVDTQVFQRLRYVRQLGLAFLVYPGATHSRFEHALGTYHLSRRTLSFLTDRDTGFGIDAEDQAVVRAAALLHDVGHYPFSHALEEIGQLHHEDVARPLITVGEIARILADGISATAPQRVFELIRGTSGSALQGLISGSLDLDKIEYLKRDGFMCGVPYGEIDVDRLTNSMLILNDPHSGRQVLGVREKGLSALESLLFAKYQMYRNVYWHHGVRSATAMYKRMVDDALRAGAIDAELLPSYTDEGLLHRLEHAHPTPILDALRTRRLYKRALEWPASQLDDGFGEWIATDRENTRAAEDEIGRELGMQPGEVLLDFPMKTQMLGLDIPVQRRSGEVERLTGEGWPGTINLPTLSEELYRSARWLRVFVARRVEIAPRRVKAVLDSLMS